MRELSKKQKVRTLIVGGVAAAVLLGVSLLPARADECGLTCQLQAATHSDEAQNARYAQYLAQRDNPATRTVSYYACQVSANIYRPLDLQRAQPCTQINPGDNGF